MIRRVRSPCCHLMGLGESESALPLFSTLQFFVPNPSLYLRKMVSFAPAVADHRYNAPLAVVDDFSAASQPAAANCGGVRTPSRSCGNHAASPGIPRGIDKPRHHEARAPSRFRVRPPAPDRTRWGAVLLRIRAFSNVLASPSHPPPGCRSNGGADGGSRDAVGAGKAAGG